VDVSTKDKRLRDVLEGETACRKRYGADMCRKLLARVAALKAAETLADFWPPKSGPERCHELVGKEKGTFSLDVKQPYRLLFKPIETETLSDDPDDEHSRWKAITAVELLTVEDTHG
jgi:plasmid maintenance system killer protein